MSMYRGAYARPMREIFEEAFDVLRQDVSEYAFIGFVGAVIASIAVLVPAVIGGPIAVALIGPLVTIVAVMTLATCEAALSNVSSGLQPDAATAARTAVWRTPPVLRAWLPLAAFAAIASVGAWFAAPYMGPVPVLALVPPIVAIAALYAYPRSLQIAAIFEHDATARDAVRLSATLVNRADGRVWKAWAAVCAPATVIALMTAATRFDAVAGALVVFFFVAALPAAAVLMSLIFVDTASGASGAPDAAPELPLTSRSGAAIRRA